MQNVNSPVKPYENHLAITVARLKLTQARTVATPARMDAVSIITLVLVVLSVLTALIGFFGFVFVYMPTGGLDHVAYYVFGTMAWGGLAVGTLGVIWGEIHRARLGI